MSNSKWLSAMAFATLKGGGRRMFVFGTNFSKLEDIEQEDAQLMSEAAIQMACAETGRDVVEMVICFKK